MDICKAPTLRLKALNKHSITQILYIEMEMLSVIKMYIKKKKKRLTHKCRQGFKRNYAKDTHTHTHTHTHTVQTDRGDGQCCLAEIF